MDKMQDQMHRLIDSNDVIFSIIVDENPDKQDPIGQKPGKVRGFVAYDTACSKDEVDKLAFQLIGIWGDDARAILDLTPKERESMVRLAKLKAAKMVVAELEAQVAADVE